MDIKHLVIMISIEFGSKCSYIDYIYAIGLWMTSKIIIMCWDRVK